MDHLPVASRSFDLIVAHDTWNLAPFAAVLRRAVRLAGHSPHALVK